MKIHVLYEHSADLQPHGCSHIRLLLPLQHPANRGAWDVTHGVDYPGGADVVIVERTWRPGPGSLAAAEALVERVRREHARLIYSLDDNLLDWSPRVIAQRGPTAEQLSVIRLLAREADGVIVSTPALRERLRLLNPRIQVVSNALDERLLARAGGDDSDGRQRLVIGFMGTHSHDADLRLVLEPLRAVLRTHASHVEFQLIGGVADGSLRRAFEGLPVRVLDTDRPVDYPAFMRWLTARVRWDIALAPLEDTPFTRCKSDIKFLDYAALGAAGIFSAVPAYTGTVQDGVTGYLVENSVDAWRAALELLVRDDVLRSRLAHAARNYLLSQRTLAQCARQWQSAIMAFVNNIHGVELASYGS